MNIYTKTKAGTFNRKQVNHIKTLTDVKSILRDKKHFFANLLTVEVTVRKTNTQFTYISPVLIGGVVRYVFTDEPIY